MIRYHVLGEEKQGLLARTDPVSIILISRIGIRIYVEKLNPEFRSFRGSKWRVGRPLVADSHHFDEDPDPD